MKSSTSWRLTYTRPFHGSFSSKLFPADSRNIHTGVDEFLLTTGKVINRPPRREAGESLMVIPFAEIVTRFNVQTGTDQKYKSMSFEVPNGKIEGLEENQKRILESNQAKLEFMKRSLYVSWKDYSGKELNTNFPTDSADFYILENLDDMEYQKSSFDEKIKTLGYELVQIKKNKTEFYQLCYLFGINISTISVDMAYNLLSDTLTKNPDAFAKKMNDPDRWYKIVINKALRTLLPGHESMYLTEESAGEFTNYFQHGKLIATGFDALVGYYKDNVEIFEALESDLGLKKNGVAPEVEQTKPEPVEQELPKKRIIGKTKVQEV